VEIAHRVLEGGEGAGEPRQLGKEGIEGFECQFKVELKRQKVNTGDPHTGEGGKGSGSIKRVCHIS